MKTGSFMSYILGVLFSCLAQAELPNFERESRLADEIVDGIMDGDAEWLTANNREFLSIFTEADDPQGAVIILHGRGFHPDWADTINPLRVGLAEQGWATLSLQMPVLVKEAKYYDYVPLFPFSFPRINAGIEFLVANGYPKITLIAHSCGAHMAMAWLKQNGDNKLNAFIGLGLGATDYKQPMIEPFALNKLTVPTLDLYGENEYPAVIRMAPERKLAIDEAGHPLSRQIVLSDADHYFTDKGEQLVVEISKWLASLKSKD
jgi:hypothetical protein